MNGALDPALLWIVRASLALLFAAASFHKLRDIAAFRAALGNYALLPRVLLAPAAWFFPMLEAAVACALWFPSLAPAAARAAAAILALYGGAIAINLARGRRHIDCGCAGPARRQALSAPLVVRNALLAGAALLAGLPSTARPLLWVDGVTIAAGVALLALLYVAVDGLLAHAPRIALLRLVRHSHPRVGAAGHA